METIKDKFFHYWFLLSSVALAILYLFYDRRGRKIAELHTDAQVNLLTRQISKIQDKAEASQEGFTNAIEDYAALKRRHADVLTKLGVGPSN